MATSPNPFIHADGKKPTCMEMLQTILDGRYDDYIARWARAAAADGRPMILRSNAPGSMDCGSAHTIAVRSSG